MQTIRLTFLENKTNGTWTCTGTNTTQVQVDIQTNKTTKKPKFSKIVEALNSTTLSSADEEFSKKRTKTWEMK